jgi:hypothetical protein
VQSYPTGGAGNQPVPGPQGPVPRTLDIAVKFMYAGAALSLVSLIVGLTTVGSEKAAIKKAFPKYTASQVHSAEMADIAIVILAGVIGIGLWLWMARATGTGHNYGRITGTVLFAVYTLNIAAALARPHASLALVFDVLVWLAGLGAVVFMWRRESSAYFSRGPVT